MEPGRRSVFGVAAPESEEAGGSFLLRKNDTGAAQCPSEFHRKRDSLRLYDIIGHKMTRFNAAPKWSSSLRLHTSGSPDRPVASSQDFVEPTQVAGHLIDVVQRLSLAPSMEEIVNIVRTAARQLTGADGA